jgi:hypothetical protein
MKLFVKSSLLLLLAIASFALAGLMQTVNSDRAREPLKTQESLLADNTRSHPTNEFLKDSGHIDSLTQSRDLDRMLAFADEIEKKWENSIPAKSRLLAKISDSLSSYDFQDERQYVYSVTFAKKVLTRSDVIDVQLEHEMVSKLQSTSAYSSGVERPEKWPVDRKERVQLILHLWNRIRNNLDRTFDTTDIRNRPNAKVRVPGPYTTGVRPEDIKEPVVRTMYEDAIAKNKTKADRFNLQVQLQKLDKTFPVFVERVLVEFYSMGPSDAEDLRRKLDLFDFPPAVKLRIVGATGMK